MSITRPNERVVAFVCVLILIGVSVGAYKSQQQRDKILESSNSSIVNGQTKVADKNDASLKKEVGSPPTESSGRSPKLPIDYTYTAQAGDTYTSLVRDALHKHISLRQLSITDEALYTAELTLLDKAGYPELNIGQVVQINYQDVMTAIDSAI
jgi:hypothetical protein